MWANHHALFRLIDRVDQLLLLLFSLLLLGCVSFLTVAPALMFLLGPSPKSGLTRSAS
jgi:uncharacterized membrane protein